MTMSLTEHRLPVGTVGATESRYDVVVIGAGVSGLTAAATLALDGQKVLVVEAEEHPGGYARAFRHSGYVFDRADHLIWGCAPDSPFGPGLIDAVLRRLGVRDQCEFVRMDDPMYVGQFPGIRVLAPRGRQGFLDAHIRDFPAQRAGLQRLLDLGSAAARELAEFPVNPSRVDLLTTFRRFPTLFRYRNATMADVIDRELTEPTVKSLYLTLWPWLGLPPRHGSFLMWASMMAYFIEDGGYYCKGSFQAFADALADGLRRAGGELVLGVRATRIVTDARQVRGVELSTGQRISTSHVISTIDPRDTFGRLVPPSALKSAYARRLRSARTGAPTVGLYAATDLDVTALNAHHDTTLYTGFDHDQTFRDLLAGDTGMLTILIPTLKDPSLAPAGEHIVILKTVGSQPGKNEPASTELEERILSLAEQTLPGLSHHLRFVLPDDAGSHVHDLGLYAGWAATPTQVGASRLPQQTPIAGLVLAGQWTRPGHGVVTVARSGIGAAALTLGSKTAAGLAG
jgi:phytoene dehydrogenase-like protein